MFYELLTSVAKELLNGGTAMPSTEITSANETVARPPAHNNNHESIDPIHQLPVRYIAVESLHSGFFVRGTGTNPAHVQMLSEVASFSELPPILVQKSTLRIIDGAHRFEAAKRRGEITIRARVINCADNDAFILAVKANTLHGLPLSRADRVLGAKRILCWHPDWSDRTIGTATGLSPKTIAAVRRESGDDRQQIGKRLGRDGKRRPVTAIEGRKRAADFITARPEASLREIARETDVSLGTVQDVRARVRGGLDPLTPGRVSPPLKAAGNPGNEPEPTRPAQFPSRLGARRGSHQSTWSGISHKLADDPRLKYTEDGRAFMRWMIMHVSNTGQWEEFVDSIPAHWLSDIGSVAEQASADWHEFAEYLKSRHDKAVLAGLEP
jgi:ParB-like chromosome segregation protein Spo0J